MKKKKAMLLFLAALLIINVSACGSTSANGSESKSTSETATEAEQTSTNLSVKALSKDEFLKCFSDPVEITEENWKDYIELMFKETVTEDTDAFGEATGDGSYSMNYVAQLKNCFIDSEEEAMDDALVLRFNVSAQYTTSYSREYSEGEEVLSPEEMLAEAEANLSFNDEITEDYLVSGYSNQNYFELHYENISPSNFDLEQYVSYSETEFYVDHLIKINDVSLTKAKGSVIPYTIDDSYWETDADGSKVLYVLNSYEVAAVSEKDPLEIDPEKTTTIQELYCLNLGTRTIDLVDTEDPSVVINTYMTFDGDSLDMMQEYYSIISGLYSGS